MLPSAFFILGLVTARPLKFVKYVFNTSPETESAFLASEAASSVSPQYIAALKYPCDETAVLISPLVSDVSYTALQFETPSFDVSILTSVVS